MVKLLVIVNAQFMLMKLGMLLTDHFTTIQYNVIDFYIVCFKLQLIWEKGNMKKKMIITNNNDNKARNF